MSDQTIFLVMVFLVGFLLAQSFVTPLLGTSRRSRSRLRERIRSLSSDVTGGQHVSAVRERYLQDLSPFARWALQLPGMAPLQTLLEQAGSRLLPHHFFFISLLAGSAGAVVAAASLHSATGGLVIGLICMAIPSVLVRRKRDKRIARFEEQLPDTLTIMARALRAGLPFTEALHLVADEMKDPAATEFGLVFREVNYGGDPRAALLALMERVPSVAVMALVTSVLVQRSTGGNLSELFDKLSDVLRTRFKFQRRVRTLSAEGRLAGWILSLLPFAMAGMFALLDPEFVPMLTKDPIGRELVMWSFGFLVVGILWLRRIVKIDV
jgi:tight adherence protein B